MLMQDVEIASAQKEVCDWEESKEEGL